jgi:hypothetical protein
MHPLRPETPAAAMPVKVQLAACATPAAAALADQQHVLAPRALIEHHCRREMYFKAACAQAFAGYLLSSTPAAFLSLARHNLCLPISNSHFPRLRLPAVSRSIGFGGRAAGSVAGDKKTRLGSEASRLMCPLTSRKGTPIHEAPQLLRQ